MYATPDEEAHRPDKSGAFPSVSLSQPLPRGHCIVDAVTNSPIAVRHGLA